MVGALHPAPLQALLQLCAFLTLLPPVRIMNFPHGDVAELADAQVSEACDGDIVEVQVLSSPPIISTKRRIGIPACPSPGYGKRKDRQECLSYTDCFRNASEPVIKGARFCLSNFGTPDRVARITKVYKWFAP